MFRRVLLAVAMLGFAVIAQASDALARSQRSPEIEARAQSLGPGDFLWEPQRAPDGPVEIVIGLGDQRAYVFRDGRLIGASTVSTGREGYETPVGRFHILEKRRDHRSNLYDDAPMPFMQRLDWSGIALHGGHLPGYPASHGCIRLPMEFARHLFETTGLGTYVFVTDGTLGPPEAALALARAHADAPISAERTPEWISASR